MAVVYYNKESISENPIDEQNLKLLYVCQADNSETIIPTAMHEHTNHLEIQYISGGMADIRIGGYAYRVKESDVVIYNAGVLHDERADPNCGMSFYNCGIKNLKLPCLPEGHLLPHDVKPVLHSGGLSEDIRSIFHLLFKQVAEKKLYAAYVCRHLLKALLVILTTQLPQEKLIRRDKFDASFQVCKAFIDEHFTENISVEELSKIANMSVSGFSHHFKKIFGISPGQYLIRLKIGLGQKLLITTDKSITEISMSLGYDNISHFNNQFKKFVGASPQNYRKLWLGNEQFQNLNHIYNELMKL
ncbi:MAG: helix-turn-helix transcriptional regulator [Selenomonadaceae bacterium]|nr:helix-turn-helix transcriptional regulator [Selenomonadaceae bacterium]